MNKYASWAEEYRKSAEITKQKIEELEKRRKHSKRISERNELDRKLLVLYEMYGDCVLSYRELMKKALSIREEKSWN